MKRAMLFMFATAVFLFAGGTAQANTGWVASAVFVETSDSDFGGFAAADVQTSTSNPEGNVFAEGTASSMLDNPVRAWGYANATFSRVYEKIDAMAAPLDVGVTVGGGLSASVDSYFVASAALEVYAEAYDLGIEYYSSHFVTTPSENVDQVVWEEGGIELDDTSQVSVYVGVDGEAVATGHPSYPVWVTADFASTLTAAFSEP